MSETNGKAKLFEYAVIVHPELDENDKPKGRAELIVQPTHVLAHDDREAFLRAAKSLPDEVTEYLDRVEIAIRPF